MAVDQRQQEIGQGRRFLAWPVKEKYYWQSVGGLYRIAKTFDGPRVIYSAFTARRQGAGKWSRYDTGRIGTHDSLQAAIESCEQYEIDFQAGHIEGAYYGAAS